MRITVHIDLPGVPEGTVSSPNIVVQTPPDTSPCQCRHHDAEHRDWFADQDRRERLARRTGTILEGRVDA